MKPSEQQLHDEVDRLPRWLVLSLAMGLIESTKEKKGQHNEQH